ncbi:DNA-binding LacI/PurR family transcriptional regulator [Diaminobutyricimonas aerilata]|uniref:DNA-binding LacI/PurR family transcriptional regulator n=1 Tax=Diaminobutyricimonas aerilata TaxID=1162967 RepID=A0A2M9CLS1_9MICO|nr:DNA-binding LacI/PurR family transcriptional regulator [Diaminobutyricimonas aerilata]
MSAPTDRAVRATVKDVALRAGVSPKTVSNVLNGVVFVRPDTRERVEAAMLELDYVPNLSARGLRNGRSGIVALALPALDTAYSSEMSHAFVEVAHERGMAVLFEETGAEPQREWELISRARAHLIDGVVLNPVRLDESAVGHGADLPPVVLIGEVEQHRTDQVWVDSVDAARKMTQHLLDQGCRRIAVVGTVGGGFDSSTARQRTAGYRAALETAGVPHDPRLEVGCQDWTTANAARAFGALLDSGVEVDACFCFTDSMALGALHALWSRGIRVPDDMLVAGFDDVDAARFAVPPLTTVAFDKREFATAALSLLAERFLDRDREPRLISIPHRVVVRESTTR